MNTHCLRCNCLCQTGTKDAAKRAIHQAEGKGLCANCMITKFLRSIEPISTLIDGCPPRGEQPERKGLGPEIFLNAAWHEQILRPVLKRVLAHTQLPEDAINWIEVCGNWGLPWPKNQAPKTDLFQ